MSSLPREQQSLAGGILSAVNRLLSNITLSISTAVYYAGSQKQTTRGDDTGLGGYKAAFWMLVGIAGVNLLLVPFLKIERISEAGTLDVTDREPLTEKEIEKERNERTVSAESVV
jgi:hypothetical protein